MNKVCYLTKSEQAVYDFVIENTANSLFSISKTEISRRLGLSQKSVMNAFLTFCNLDIVEKTNRNFEYKIKPFVYDTEKYEVDIYEFEKLLTQKQFTLLKFMFDNADCFDGKYIFDMQHKDISERLNFSISSIRAFIETLKKKKLLSKLMRNDYFCHKTKYILELR